MMPSSATGLLFLFLVELAKEKQLCSCCLEPLTGNLDLPDQIAEIETQRDGIIQTYFYCSQEDLTWILDVFMKKRQEGNTRLLDIEVDHGFKLCLHQRDFRAGCPIIHCIHQAVQQSRRVIFVLSRCPLNTMQMFLFGG